MQWMIRNNYSTFLERKAYGKNRAPVEYHLITYSNTEMVVVYNIRIQKIVTIYGTDEVIRYKKKLEKKNDSD